MAIVGSAVELLRSSTALRVTFLLRAVPRSDLLPPGYLIPTASNISCFFAAQGSPGTWRMYAFKNAAAFPISRICSNTSTRRF
jgi:hypothetical protein